MDSDKKAEIIKINSSKFGELEIPSTSLINIVSGIIGFPSVKRYVLLDYNPPFSWLQAADNPDLAFVVVNAAEFGENYNFTFPIGDREIELLPNDEVAIINVVSIRPDPSQTTVNLKAPIVVNLRNRRGRQIVLDDSRFSTRFPLWSK